MQRSVRIAPRIALSIVLAAAACTDPALHDEGMLAVRPAVTRDSIQGGTLDDHDLNVVAILFKTPQGLAICSGSLIAPNLVLSAHHCVADVSSMDCGSGSFGSLFSASSFAITTSTSAASTYFSQGKFPAIDNTSWFGVRNVWVPGDDICGNDVSLLELSANLGEVCPLLPRVDTVVGSKEAYRAVGFGITSPSGRTAGKRYEVSGLSVLCAANCGRGMSATLEWEGGTTAAKGTCEGDSGGPALDAQGRVIGTVSRGPANACNDTVYESVAGTNGRWIKTKAAQAATDGRYTAAGWVNGASTSDSANGYCPSGGGAGGGGGNAGGGGGNAGGGGGSTGGGGGSTGGGGGNAGGGGGSTGGGGGNAGGGGGSTGGGGGNAGGGGGSASGGGGRTGGGGGSAGSGGGSAGGGGGSAGGGGGSTGGGAGGTCSNDLDCVDGSGQGEYGCFDSTAANGVPVGALRCHASSDCPSGSSCWAESATSTSGSCIQDCSPAGTGGGTATGGGTSGKGGGTARGGIASDSPVVGSVGCQSINGTALYALLGLVALARRRRSARR